MCHFPLPTLSANNNASNKSDFTQTYSTNHALAQLNRLFQRLAVGVGRISVLQHLTKLFEYCVSKKQNTHTHTHTQ